MKRKLSTQLSLGFALIVLVTVALISLVANLLINHQFEKYVENQQKEFADGLAEGLSDQYDPENGKWNLDYIHGFGMYALNDGYIIKLYDTNEQVVWDAENHDMTLCHQIMDNISLRMQEKQPELKGDFVSTRYELEQNGLLIGYVDISYYSPYYFNENAFHFVDFLNRVLLVIGILSVLGAGIAGILLAKRISRPIAETTEVTRKISDGNYDIRFHSDTKTKELHELTQSVNHMAEALSEQETLRKRLTTDVAHELRTPLSNVSAHLEALMEGVWEPTPQRLQSCYDELKRISGIVSDLEKLRQIESENLVLDKKPVNLLELSKTVCTSFESEFEKKNVHCFVKGAPAIVYGDETRLHQVIFNLLSNALKFSAGSGEITIQVQDSEAYGIVTVEDKGIGIPEKDLPLIFERFYRTDRSRYRKTGGSGIGLTITKAIVQAHGGKITAESKVGHGSRFIVTLPKSKNTGKNF